jgi:hypothetical protein
LEVLPWRRREKKEGRRKTSIFDLVISPKWIESSLLGAPGFGVTGFARFPYSFFIRECLSLFLAVLFFLLLFLCVFIFVQ